MQVFREAIEKNGGPLPLLYYLQPDAGSAPDGGSAPYRGKEIDLLHTSVDRRTFFECILSDADFAVLATFLMSGVPVNATRGEDGASALHIAAAGTLEVLSNDNSQGGGSYRQIAGGDSAGGGSVCGYHAATHEEALAEGVDENLGSTSSLLSPPCQNQLILSFLIDNGADVNAAMRGGQWQTPLMVAASRPNVRVVKLLLAKGADATVQDIHGRTVLSYAVGYPHVMEVLRLWMGNEVFYAAAVRERLLHMTCRSLGNTYAALYLIEQIGLDVNRSNVVDTDASPATPAPQLLGQGLPVDPRSPRRDGIQNRCHTHDTTAPFFAGDASDDAHNQQRPVQSPANSASPTTNTTTMAGARNLTHAPCTGVGDTGAAAVEVVVMHALNSGDTPLHCAVSTADVALVRALLSKGANVHAANYSGVTPLQLARSQSSVAQSWKQYWKDELIVMLQPASVSAAAARRRHRERQRDKSLREVRALLTAYSRASTTPSREKLLREEPAWYQWKRYAPMDAVLFVATATLPHIFFYICCCIIRNFFVLLCLLPLVYVAYVGLQRLDRRRVQSRPLSDLGWFSGFLFVQGLCLCLCATSHDDLYARFGWYHKARSWCLVTTVAATGGLAACVMLLSPGLVASTEGQRKGVYASLGITRGTYERELLYSMDLRTMVKKPLRAQYCPQLRRIVLRYDHFCTFLNTAIGGGNHRAFLWLHVALLSMLSCFYSYACEYGRLLSNVSDLARTSAASRDDAPGKSTSSVAVAMEVDRVVTKKLETAPLATAWRRFVYTYSQVILPFMILVVLHALCNQLSALARNLTLYDMEHSEDESSMYCFTLGNRVYSLFDKGVWANLREFFGWSSLTQKVYRVPQINPYLQELVKDHQRWQLTGSDGCGGSGNPQHQPCTHASGAAYKSEAEVAAAGIPTTVGAMARPTELGESESAGAQQMLRTQPHEALATAAGSAHVGTPYQGDEAAEQQPQSVRQADQDGEEAHDEGAYYDDNGEGREVSVLAMCIFQEMVRSGLIDIGHGDSREAMAAAAAHGGGADAETQEEWDAAVEKAKQMYRFYQQSMGHMGEGNY